MNNNRHFTISTIHSIIDFLLYSSLYRAIGSFCAAVIAGAALGAPFDVAAYSLPPLVVLVGYTFDYLMGMRGDADRVNQPTRYQYFQRHWRMSLIVAGGALIAVILICFHRSLLLGIFLVALPLVIGTLYSFGWKQLFPNAKFGRLKDNTFAKPITTGLGRGIVQVLVPAFYLNLPFNLWVFLLWGYISWRWVFNSIIYDIADVEGDRQSGTRTFPVVYGIQKTVSALAIANGLSFVWVALMSGITWNAQVALGVGLLYSFGYLYLSTRVSDRRIFSLVVSGQFVVIYLVFVLLQLLYPAIG